MVAMKHTLIKVSTTVAISVLAVYGIAHAAGVIDIAEVLGGTSGDTFKLNGKLNTQSLLVRDNARVKGNLTVDGKLKNVELAAEKVTYDNDSSGLAATTAQAALDELSQTLVDKVNGTLLATSAVTPSVTLDGSTWTVTVHDVWNDTYRETTELDGSPLTVSFTPIDATSGTFESAPVNVFYPYEQIQEENNVGTVTGDYNVVGDTIMVSNLSGTSISTGLTVQVSLLSDGTMVFEETRVSPPAVVVLEPAS